MGMGHILCLLLDGDNGDMPGNWAGREMEQWCAAGFKTGNAVVHDWNPNPSRGNGGVFNRLAEWTSRQVEAEQSYAGKDLSPNSMK